jgi:hypothetical protein
MCGPLFHTYPAAPSVSCYAIFCCCNLHHFDPHLILKIQKWHGNEPLLLPIATPTLQWLKVKQKTHFLRPLQTEAGGIYKTNNRMQMLTVAACMLA